MRLLHVSDTHGSGSHERGLIEWITRQSDDLVVIHSGDIQTNKDASVSRGWKLTDRRRTRLFVRGNHDLPVQVGSPLRNWTQNAPPWSMDVGDCLFVGLDSEARKDDGPIESAYDSQVARLSIPSGEYRTLVVVQHQWPDERCVEGERARHQARIELEQLKRGVASIHNRTPFERLLFCNGHFHQHSPMWFPSVEGFGVPASMSRMFSKAKSWPSEGGAHLITLSDDGISCLPIEGVRPPREPRK